MNLRDKKTIFLACKEWDSELGFDFLILSEESEKLKKGQFCEIMVFYEIEGFGEQIYKFFDN